MLERVARTISEHEAWLETHIAPLADLRPKLAAMRHAICNPPIVYKSHEGAFALPLAVSRTRWDAWARASVSLVDLVWRHVNTNISRHGATFLNRIGVDDGLAQQLNRTPPPTGADALMARPDFFLGDDGPLFLETNIDSSLGGLGTADPLTRLYQRCGLAQGLAPLWAVPTLARQIRKLTARPDPRVLIVDWQDEIHDVPWPYDRLAEDMVRSGLSAEISGPERLRLDKGRLIDRRGAFDAVYRGVTPVSRLWTMGGEDDPFGPVWAAASEGTPLLSSLWAVAYSSKGVLAHLWEGVLSGDLSAADAAFVRCHVPWACLLDQPRVRPFGDAAAETVDLEEFAARFRDSLVLKSPSDGSCKNITVGRFTPAQVWAQAIRDARSQPGYSLQHYVAPPQVLTFGASDQLESHALNLAVFVVGGDVAGTCVRGSAPKDPYISCMHGAREGTTMVIPESWT